MKRELLYSGKNVTVSGLCTINKDIYRRPEFTEKANIIKVCKTKTICFMM